MAATNQPPRQRKRRTADGLPDGDSPIDWRVTGAAAAVLCQVADHRNQLVRSQPVATDPAMGGRPQDGFAAGHSIEDELKETTQRHTQWKQEGCAEQVAQEGNQWGLLASKLNSIL